jgi:hypothetical protein
VNQREEFLTQWEPGPPTIWAKRDEDRLISSSKGGHLMVPAFRPFDFVVGPNQPLLFLTAPSNRALVEALRGTQATFHRNADFEDIHFQVAGQTVYETEFGTYTATPACLTLIPAGTAYRATGIGGSLRMTMQIRDAVEIKANEGSQVGHTEYDVVWREGPDWPDPPKSELFKKGRVLESVHTWEDKPGDETLIERDFDRVVGSIYKGPGINQVRLFDIFKEMTGKRGPGPVSLINQNFFTECYNTVGEQWAYHRANRSEEAQFQFFGRAENISEFGNDLMNAGDIYIQRRGIAHRVKGSPDYRRFVFYSREPWKLLMDPTKPLRRTTFEVTERVLEPAPWREEIQKYLAEAAAR